MTDGQRQGGAMVRGSSHQMTRLSRKVLVQTSGPSRFV